MPESMFRSLDTEKRSLFVAKQIIQLIESGRFKVGDRLPPERQICDETGVSRPSVREAIVALELLGIVERRAGAGTTVLRSIRPRRETEEILEFLSTVFRGENMPLHLMEARRALEFGALQLRFEDIEPSDLDDLELALKSMRAAMDSGDPLSYFEADMDFHRALMDLAGNPVIQSINDNLVSRMKGLAGWFEALEKYWSADVNAYMAVSYEVHAEIFAAIQSGDLALVNQVLNRHYEQSVWWKSVSDRSERA